MRIGVFGLKADCFGECGSGFPAGSTADISARVIGAKMGQILGQQFVIENRLGAGSSLAGAQAYWDANKAPYYLPGRRPAGCATLGC